MHNTDEYTGNNKTKDKNDSTDNTDNNNDKPWSLEKRATKATQSGSSKNRRTMMMAER